MKEDRALSRNEFYVPFPTYEILICLCKLSIHNARPVSQMRLLLHTVHLGDHFIYMWLKQWGGGNMFCMHPSLASNASFCF